MNTPPIVIFENEFLDKVLTPLRGISKENGYESDLTVLEGWLTHYAADLEKGVRGRSFPAVAAHSRQESIVTQRPVNRGDPVAAENIRRIVIEGGVSANDPEQINGGLESLLRDIKRALSPFARSLTIVSVDFILPEGSNRYAFLQIDAEIKYNETWND